MSNDKGRLQRYTKEEIEDKILVPSSYGDGSRKMTVGTLPYDGETGEGLEQALEWIETEMSEYIHVVSDECCCT